MKKALLLLAFLSFFSFVEGSVNDKSIRFHQLPEKAQKFIRTNFETPRILKVLQNDSGDEFEVRISGGLRVEFDKNGKWTELESKRKCVPAKLIPTRIRKAVKEQFGDDVRIIEFSREDDELEVKLSNGKELEFERKGTKIDD